MTARRWSAAAAAIVCAACAAPLLVIAGPLAGDEAGRAAVVAALAWTALALSVLAPVGGGVLRPGLVPALVVAFAAVYATSARAGVDPESGTWGTATRGVGAAAAAGLAAIVFASRRAAAVAVDRRAILLAVAIGTGLAACWSAVEGVSEVAGGAGLACAAAAWMLAAEVESRRCRAAAWTAVAVSASITVAAGAASSAAGLAIGTIVAAVGMLSTPGSRRAGRGMLIGVAALLATTFAARLASAPLERVSIARAVARPATVLGEPDGVREIRWGTAALTARYRPIVGVGPASYRHADDYYYSVDVARFGVDHESTDDAGSLVATALAERGAAGVLLWVALLGAAAFALVRRHEAGVLATPAAAAGLGYIAAVFTHSLGAREDLATLTALFVVLGVLLHAGSDASEARVRPRRLLRWCVAAALALAAIGTGFLPAAWAVMRSAALARASQYPAAAERAYVRALSLGGPRLDEFRVAFAGAVLRDRRRPVAEGELELPRRRLLVTLGEDLDAVWRRRWSRWQRERRAPDTRVALARAEVAEALARHSGDAAQLDDAAATLEQALDFSFSARRQDLRFALARVHALRGDRELALTLAEDALADEERAPQSHERMAEVRALVRGE